MKQKTLTLTTCLLMIGLVCLWAYAQDDPMVIDNSVFESPARPAAAFQHDEHNEKAGIEECIECHHIYEDGVLQEYESSEDQLCSECHGVESSDNTLPLMKAFHKNCKGCHTEKKAGPVMCGECHIRSGNA